MNEVYYKDSRKMSEVADNSISLVITSPPYIDAKDYSAGEQKQDDIGRPMDYQDYLFGLKQVWAECGRVLEPNGKLCINVPLMPVKKEITPDRHCRHIFNLSADIERGVLEIKDLELLDIYIWKRTNGVKAMMFGSYPYPPNFYAQNNFEFISLYVKEGKPKQRSKEEKEKSKITEKEWTEYTKGVWDLPIPNKAAPGYDDHPAIMPEEIAYRLIKLYSFKGDTVLDPFSGSGTTLRVAKRIGRNYIGYELYEKYRPTIENALEQETLL